MNSVVHTWQRSGCARCWTVLIASVCKYVWRTFGVTNCTWTQAISTVTTTEISQRFPPDWFQETAGAARRRWVELDVVYLTLRWVRNGYFVSWFCVQLTLRCQSWPPVDRKDAQVRCHFHVRALLLVAHTGQVSTASDSAGREPKQKGVSFWTSRRMDLICIIIFI